MPKFRVRQAREVFVGGCRGISLSAAFQPFDKLGIKRAQPRAGLGRLWDGYRLGTELALSTAAHGVDADVCYPRRIRSFPEPCRRNLVVLSKKSLGHGRFAPSGFNRPSEYILFAGASHPDKP